MGSSSRAPRWTVLLGLGLLVAGCGAAAEARAGSAAPPSPPAGGSGGFAAYTPAGSAASGAAMETAEPTSLDSLAVARRSVATSEQSAAESDEGFRVEVGGEAPSPEAQDYRPQRPPVTVAQAQPQPQPQQPGAGGGQTPPATATDAVDGTGPLLIYEAELYLAVNEIRQRQQEAIGVVREMGGFVARQDDTSVVLRVPARRFNEALSALERIGDVLHRTVQSHDVTEEFHDLDVRLRNALAIRDRLQQLLERAGNVQDSLVVERELERITMSIEQMRGRMRFLSDRIAFSTITLRFQGLPTESLGPAASQFRLPFPWLDQLGLSNLLDLSTAE